MRDNIQKIEVDYDNKIIICGDIFKLKSYVPKLDWKYVSSKCGYSVGKNGKGTKLTNKKVSEKLGMPPKRYAKIIRGIQYKLWIKDNKDLIFKLCTSHSKNFHIINSEDVALFHERINLIEQYKKDNLYNLIPFAFRFNKTTQDLKKELGKSLWKSLCKNSFTRNKMISEKMFTQRAETLNKLSSHILSSRHIERCHAFPILWVDNFLKKERALTTNKYDIERLLHICTDTHRMAKQLNLTLNLNCSLKKLEEKHKEYTMKVELERYPDTFIDALSDIPIKEYKNKKYEAILLDTPYKIKRQGVEQRHCVASYSNYVVDGSYIIYNIKENDKTVSTLGISVESNRLLNTKKYIFSQQYGQSNTQVCDELVQFKNELLKELNKNLRKA